jgi:hypothetical protein
LKKEEEKKKKKERKNLVALNRRSLSLSFFFVLFCFLLFCFFSPRFMGTVSVDDQNHGTRAGAAGGTTLLVDFIIPKRDQSLVEATLAWKAKVAEANTDLAAHCAITYWNDKVSEEMGILVKEHGITSFKMFLAYKLSGFFWGGKVGNVN